MEPVQVQLRICTGIPYHYRSPEVEPGRAESQYRYNKGFVLASLFTTGARRWNHEGWNHSTGTIIRMCTAIPYHYRSPEVELGRAESQYRYNNKDVYCRPLSVQEPGDGTRRGESQYMYNKGCVLPSLITTEARRWNQEERSHSTGTIKDLYWHPLSLQKPGGGTRKSGVTVHVQ